MRCDHDGCHFGREWDVRSPRSLGGGRGISRREERGFLEKKRNRKEEKPSGGGRQGKVFRSRLCVIGTCFMPCSFVLVKKMAGCKDLSHSRLAWEARI